MNMLVSATAIAAAQPAAAAAKLHDAAPTIEKTADPVFEAIERHRQAYLAYDEALAERSQCETVARERGALHRASVVLPLIKIVEGQPCVQIAEGDGRFSSAPLTDDLLLDPGKAVVRHCYRRNAIDEALPGIECEGARKKAHRQLASASRRRARVRQAAGLPAADRKVAATYEEEQSAQRDLARVIPQTAAGAMTVITYWREHAGLNLSGVINDDDSEFLMAMLASLHASFGQMSAQCSM